MQNKQQNKKEYANAINPQRKTYRIFTIPLQDTKSLLCIIIIKEYYTYDRYYPLLNLPSLVGLIMEIGYRL